MTKEQVLKHLKTKSSWSEKEITQLISEMTSKKEGCMSPTSLQVGDVCMCRTMAHPVLIIKKNLKGVFGVVLTTTDSIAVLGEIECRTYRSKFTSTIRQLNEETLLSNYMTSIPMSEVYKINKTIKEFYKTVFNF